MKQEDIIKLAREAELIYWQSNSTFLDGVWWMDAGEPGDELEHFATLVAAAEREACAKVCECLDTSKGAGSLRSKFAAAIRARGETK